MSKISVSNASSFVGEYLYNMKAVDLIDVFRENLGIDIEIYDDTNPENPKDVGGVIYEGEVLSWAWFDGFTIDLIENLGLDSIVALYSIITNEEWELDDSGEYLVNVEENRRDEKHGLYGGKVDVAN